MTSQNQTFTADQLDALRDAYTTINTASPAMLPRFHALFDGCSDSGLVQLATARIKFVSKLAVNACARRGMSLASIHVLSLVAGGMDPVEALKEVCGAVLVDSTIESLYSELRAKAVL